MYKGARKIDDLRNIASGDEDRSCAGTVKNTGAIPPNGVPLRPPDNTAHPGWQCEKLYQHDRRRLTEFIA